MEVVEIVKDRVKLNEKLFSEEETKMILDNVEVFSRIYLLGMLDKNKCKFFTVDFPDFFPTQF